MYMNEHFGVLSCIQIGAEPRGGVPGIDFLFILVIIYVSGNGNVCADGSQHLNKTRMALL